MKAFSILAVVCSLLFAHPGLGQKKCTRGDCINGFGSCIIVNVGEYVGNFRNGRLDGKGLLKYFDGSKYAGHWVANKREGTGRMTFGNGDEYFGTFAADKFHGEGVMTYANGMTVRAIWNEGQPEQKLLVRRPNEGKAELTKGTPVDEEVRVWAVVIGAAQYAHMPILQYTDDDAYLVYAFLKSPEGGAIPDTQIELLIDENATKEKIEEALHAVTLKADENDVLLFYFSGHGIQGAFLPIDFDGFDNQLTHSELKEIFAASRAKHKLIIADACHSGTLLNYQSTVYSGLRKFYAEFENNNGGIALLMSSKGEEYSLEDRGLRSGVFSYFMIQGLKGLADTDGNYIVTIAELFEFVNVKVKDYTKDVQTPILTGTFSEKMPVAVVRQW